MKSCRVCLDLDATVTHLGNSEAVQHLQEILKNHGLDELNSKHYICFMCKYLLNKYFSFGKRIIRAQEAIRDIKSKKIKNVTLTTLNRSKLNLNFNLSCHSITNFYYGSNIEDQNDVNISVMEEDNNENDSSSDNPVILNPIDIESSINSENQGTENICEDSVDNTSNEVLKIAKDKGKEKKEEKSSRKKKIITNVIKPKTKQYKTDSDEEYNPQYDSASSGSSNEYFKYAGYIARRDFRVFPLECDECDAVIESKKEHHRHYRIYHQDKEYPYNKKSIFACQHCGATRKTIAHLKNHEKTHGQKNVECDDCGKKFHSNALMRRHQVIHGKKAFICDYCNKGFHHRAEITSHMRTHTGEKQQKGNVSYHIRTRHQPAPRNTSNKVNGKRGQGGRGEDAKKKTKTNKECATKKSDIKALRKKSTKEHIKKKFN